MNKNLMIDFRDEEEEIQRKVIDDMEFCVRNGNAYFISDGTRHEVPLDHVIQVYTT